MLNSIFLIPKTQLKIQNRTVKNLLRTVNQEL